MYDKKENATLSRRERILLDPLEASNRSDGTEHREFLIDTNYEYQGVQHRYKFNNGYGASVIKHDHSYGGKNGLWEVAILDYHIDEKGVLCYDSGITEDVIGHLDWRMVTNILNKVKAL